MSKQGQIVAITSAIQDLCGLIFTIETEPSYTEEQAAKYFKLVFEIHDITPDENEEEDENVS